MVGGQRQGWTNFQLPKGQQDWREMRRTDQGPIIDSDTSRSSKSQSMYRATTCGNSRTGTDRVIGPT